MLKNHKSNWIDAYSDNFFNIHTLPNSLVLKDVNLDNEDEMIVVDYGEYLKTSKIASEVKIKIIKGTSLLSEIRLAEPPSGIACIHVDHILNSPPVIVVALGASLFLYKNGKPFFKFNIQSIEPNAEEVEAWDLYNSGAITIDALTVKLDMIKGIGKISELSDKSVQFLALDENEKKEFASNTKVTLAKQDCITCMAPMLKRPNDEQTISLLVLATENKSVYVINPETFNYLLRTKLPSVGVEIVVCGCYDVSFKILIPCRDNSIYGIKRDSTNPKKLVSTRSPINGCVVFKKNIVVTCMDDTMMCYSMKGNMLWSAVLPGSVVTLHIMRMKLTNNSLLLVSVMPKQPLHKIFSTLPIKNDALTMDEEGNVENADKGLVLVYNNNQVLEEIKTPDVITAMSFGKFGREEEALVMFSRNGGFHVKMLKRTNKLNVGLDENETQQKDSLPLGDGKDSGSLADIDVKKTAGKFELPKKGKVYLDQLSREREMYLEIHQRFQEDLLNMKLLAAQKLITIVNDHKLNTVIPSKDTPPINMDLQIVGLGPTFRMNIVISNNSLTKPSTDLIITFQWDQAMYKIHTPCMIVSFIPPSFSHKLHTFVVCNNTSSVSSDVKVHLTKKACSSPFLTAIVDMPVPQVIE